MVIDDGEGATQWGCKQSFASMKREGGGAQKVLAMIKGGGGGEGVGHKRFLG